MHDVAVTLDDHLLGHAHTSGLGDATEIVARQVDQHHVFGALLRIGQQFRGVTRIFFRGQAAAPRPGDGANLGDAVGDADMQLG